MNEVTIYEVSCLELNKQLITGQEDNKKRLTKFIEKHMERTADECDEFYTKTITKLSLPMASIDDFSAQKDNLAEIATTIPDVTEKISLMNMIQELLPDLKNITLKKKVEKAIHLSAQGAQLITHVEDLCSSSVDKFKKEYKEL